MFTRFGCFVFPTAGPSSKARDDSGSLQPLGSTLSSDMHVGLFSVPADSRTGLSASSFSSHWSLSRFLPQEALVLLLSGRWSQLLNVGLPPPLLSSHPNRLRPRRALPSNVELEWHGGARFPSAVAKCHPSVVAMCLASVHSTSRWCGGFGAPLTNFVRGVRPRLLGCARYTWPFWKARGALLPSC